MNKQSTVNNIRLLPTRQQLQAFLHAKGMNPDLLKQMSSWEQVQLTREYKQAMNG